MSISTPLLASLQPLQTRHHIQESPSFCKPQGYLLPSQGNPKAQFLATPTTPQGSYSILLHPPQDSYTSSAKPALPAASPLFNPAVPACALYSPVHVPTRRPAYTCLHQPACLPAGHLQNLNPPHLPSPTALASRHHQVLPSCLSMSPPVCLHLPTPACLPTPARPLPYLPPSYQLPTLSILPSCAMAKVRRFIMAGLYDHISHEMHM